MNYIQILFSLITTTLIIYANLINFLEPHLPHFFSQLFRYGKFAAVKKSKLAIEVPKKWFRHFYVVAVVLWSYIFWLVTMVYVGNMRVPDYFRGILDLVCGTDRVAFVPKNKVFISIILMTLQVYRRFYDTHKISVFSEQSRMNLTHYLVGLLHYPATALAILCEAPLFANTPLSLQQSPLNLTGISLWDKLAIFAFLLAWKHQLICNKILADLRKDKHGSVVSGAYKLPLGDWFEYLSAPHQTAEIIMYTSLMWLLWNNVTWFFIFTWVLANQVETILLSHWWYKEKFEDYPEKRKALIPFVY